jgi:hypothetical protein
MKRALGARSLAVLVAMRVLAAAAPLGATPTFPSVIASALSLSAPPPCTICHTSDAGGAGTAIQPFAVYLKSRGLKPFDEGSLRTALQAAAGEQHDSNGNGVTDIDELKRGDDPNAGSASGPEYGCGARVAARPLGAHAGWSAMLLALPALLFVRFGARRKRSARP